MTKKSKAVCLIGVSAVSLLATIYSVFALESNRSINDIEKTKIIDIDFNNNKIINKVNNKTYLSNGTTGKFVSSLKGNGYEFNGDYFSIPLSETGYNENDLVLTTSFLYKYKGDDTLAYPISFGTYSLYFTDGRIGFNTISNDIYGTFYGFEKDKTYSIVLEMNKKDVTKNKIYINGVKYPVSNINGTENIYKPENAGFNNDFSIGRITNYDYQIYRVDDKSVIDEIKIFKSPVTDEQAKYLSNSHKIPELRGEVIDNLNPRLTWATEILPEDILWKSGYDTELGELLPNLKYGTFSSTGGQSFVTHEKYSGSTSLKVVDTIKNGNYYNAPATEALGKDSVNIFGSVVGLKNEVPLSISYKAKSNNNDSYVTFWGVGGGQTVFIYYNAKIAKNVLKGDTSIEIVDMKNDKDIMSKLDSTGKFIQPFYIDFDTDTKKIEYSSAYPVRADVENNLLIFDNPIPRNMSAGEFLYKRPNAFPFNIGDYKKIQGDNNWHSYSLNSTINIPEEHFDLTTRAISFCTGVKTSGEFYLDDIKVGYSTKVRLYRDNVKIYEGYDSEFNDSLSKDTSAPNPVNSSNISTNMAYEGEDRKVTINFTPVLDNETTYNYQISAVSKDGIETPLSEVLPQTVLSGIKGYSYIIDKKKDTIPDNNPSTSNTEIEYIINDNETYYLHIRAVDNAGNGSSVTHYKIDVPKLTANAKHSENLIRLDWTMDDIRNKTFKVYQKKPGSNEFQSISMTNFDNKEKVKVLNIFPTASIPEVKDSRVDLAGEKLHISALVEEWIRDYGMDKVVVDSINKESFELDPDKYLKDANGNYKYDVAVVGFWNIRPVSQHLGNKGVEAIREFIHNGRGVLTGHHHIGLDEFDKGMNLLKDEFGIKFVVESGWDKWINQAQASKIDYVIPDSISKNNSSSMYWFSNTKVKAEKKGLLLSYPHDVSEEGRIFNMEFSHNTNDFVTGDVWLSYVPGNGYYANSNEPAKNITILPDGTTGTKNAYLSTYNNTALIQTGHSSNSTGLLLATEDEKKILANTLFYLNQLSTDNFLNDNSGQDVNAPNKPTVNTFSFNKNNINLKLNPTTDNGSTYEYYVEATDKNGETTLSNKAKSTITTGFKGYSYIVDTLPLTEPDNTVETNLNDISLTMNNNKVVYLHIKAVDNSDNSSDTLHYKIEDNTLPTLNIVGNATEWTKDDITLIATASDTQTGVKQIILPNENIINGTSATFVASNNGTFVFKAIDFVGNEVTKSVVVDKIDRVPPVLTATKEINANKLSGFININIRDTLSEVDYFILPDGTEIKGQSDYKYPINSNGIYLFTGYDKLGNVSTISVEVNELNTNINTSGISKIEYKLTGATTQDWTTYTSAFYIKNEGITYITARSYDNASNVSNEEVSQVKIDKTKPINNGIKIELVK